MVRLLCILAPARRVRLTRRGERKDSTMLEPLPVGDVCAYSRHIFARLDARGLLETCLQPIEVETMASPSDRKKFPDGVVYSVLLPLENSGPMDLVQRFGPNSDPHINYSKARIFGAKDLVPALCKAETLSACALIWFARSLRDLNFCALGNLPSWSPVHDEALLDAEIRNFDRGIFDRFDREFSDLPHTPLTTMRPQEPETSNGLREIVADRVAWCLSRYRPAQIVADVPEGFMP